MNKGFLTYYKIGMSDTKKMLKKKSNFFKFFVYVIMSIFGMCIIPNITSVSLIRLSKDVHEEKKLSLLDAFDYGDKPLNIYNIIIVGLLKLLILLTGVVIASLIGGLFYFLGVGLSTLLFDTIDSTITYVLSGVGSVAFIIFMYFYIFYLSHCNYLVSETKNLLPSKIVIHSINLSKNGKLVLFLNTLMGLLIFAGYGILCSAYFYVITYILPTYTSMHTYVIKFLFCLGIIIFSLILVFVLPYAIMPSSIASYLLRKDLCNGDKENNYAYTNVNVDTSKLNKKYINVKNAEENLNTLFDTDSKKTPTENESKINVNDTLNESFIEEETPSNEDDDAKEENSLDNLAKNDELKDGDDNDTF